MTSSSTCSSSIPADLCIQPKFQTPSLLLLCLNSRTSSSTRSSLSQGCANDPAGIDQQRALKAAAEHLKLVTHTAGADELKIRVIRGLQYAARVVASASTQLVNTSQAAAKKSRASNYQVSAEKCEEWHAKVAMPLSVAFSAVRRWQGSCGDDPEAGDGHSGNTA